MTNVIQDPGFELSTGSWQCSRGTNIATVSWERTRTHTGSGSCRITRTATVDTGIISLNEGIVRYPAAGLSMWSGHAWVYPDVTEDRQMNCALLWFNSAGTVIGSAQGPIVSCPSRTWTQIFLPPSEIPETAAFTMLQINGRGGTWPPGSSWIADDVYLAQYVTMTIGSLAAAKGYGWRRFNVRTDPPVPDGRSYELQPRPGGAPFTGAISNGAGGGFTDIAIRYTAGTYVSDVLVSLAGHATANLVVPLLEFTSVITGRLVVNVAAKWIFQGGDPDGTGADGRIDWGDGSPSEPLYQLDPPTEGDIKARHQYPLIGETKSYTITLSSGPQVIHRIVTILVGTQSVLTTEDGLLNAFVDIQEWPAFEFERSATVLPIVGREVPIVLTDRVRLPQSEPVFLTRTAEEAEALLEVLKFRGRIQLQSPCEGVENGWFIVTGFTRNRLTNRGTELRRLWPTKVQEVEAP